MSDPTTPDHDFARCAGCPGAGRADEPGLRNAPDDSGAARGARDASIGASAQEVAATRTRVAASVAPARRVAMGWAHQLGR